MLNATAGHSWVKSCTHHHQYTHIHTRTRTHTRTHTHIHTHTLTRTRPETYTLSHFMALVLATLYWPTCIQITHSLPDLLHRHAAHGEFHGPPELKSSAVWGHEG